MPTTPKLASGVDRRSCSTAGGRPRRRARRRAGHARDRAARSGADRRGHRRDRALRRLGLRPRRRLAACRPGCASRAAASRVARRRACRSCPAAILFDLLNGGDKDWGRYPPYRDLGYAAAAQRRPDFKLGSAGAGLGATTVNLKGGIGSASATTRDGITVGAIVAVNAARQRDGRRRAAVLGGAIRAATASSAGAACRSPFPPDALTIPQQRRAPARTRRSPWSRPTPR